MGLTPIPGIGELATSLEGLDLLKDILVLGTQAFGAGLSAKEAARQAALNRELQRMMFSKQLQQSQYQFGVGTKQWQQEQAMQAHQARLGNLGGIPGYLGQIAQLGRPNMGR